MTLNIALLGAGRIGRVHASAISSQSSAKLVAVADLFADAANEISAQYGCEVRTIEVILNSDDVDAVVICTPTNTHAGLIEKFCHAGKAVFCEKPIDLDLARVRKCLAIVDKTRTKLMLGFNRRYDPHFLAVRDAITSGEIGTVEQVVITSRDPGLPPYDYIAASGGIFKDMTIHDFDMARFLLDEEIATVQATASVLVDQKLVEYDDFDTASLLLTTQSGRQCLISNSRRATYGYDQRIEVAGSLGMVSAENQRPVSIEIATSDGFKRPPLHDFFMTRYVEAYANEIAAFVDAVTGDLAISPTGRDGEMALILAEAALLSVAESRTVDLSEFAEGASA